MKDVAIVGLPSSGKTTVFEAVVGAHLGGGQRKEHVAVVSVPDPRVERLAELYGSAKATHAQLRLHDVPGLDPRALGTARTVDGLACVLRAFGPDADPVADLALLRAELAIADLQMVEHVFERVTKRASSGDTSARTELAVAERARTALEAGQRLSEVDWHADELRTVQLWTPLTTKPELYVVNADDSWKEDDVPERKVVIRAQLEAEAADLDRDDASELLAAYGIQRPASDEFVRAVYDALGLVTFFTANEHEAHAWAVPEGTTAPQAAGAVHTDFEHRFIRAERVSFDDLTGAGTAEAAKQRGLVRLEGKDYVVREGDVLFIRHS